MFLLVVIVIWCCFVKPNPVNAQFVSWLIAIHSFIITTGWCHSRVQWSNIFITLFFSEEWDRDGLCWSIVCRVVGDTRWSLDEAKYNTRKKKTALHGCIDRSLVLLSVSIDLFKGVNRKTESSGNQCRSFLFLLQRPVQYATTINININIIIIIIICIHFPKDENIIKWIRKTDRRRSTSNRNKRFNYTMESKKNNGGEACKVFFTSQAFLRMTLV